MRKDLKDLWLLTEPYVRDAGFDLIEVTFGRESSGWVLRHRHRRAGLRPRRVDVESQHPARGLAPERDLDQIEARVADVGLGEEPQIFEFLFQWGLPSVGRGFLQGVRVVFSSFRIG